MQKIKLGSKTVSPFTIPSGEVTTEVSCLERIAKEIAEVGFLTTKTTGLQPRKVSQEPGIHPGKAYREPIFAQYAPHCFVNAVGLVNPGATELEKILANANISSDKFLMISIFGKDPEEFAETAKILEKRADGFEANTSCPNVKGHMQMGQDPEMVRKIVAEVRKVTNKPIFVKLTPNTQNIAEIAKAAMEAGAYGITAINTVGPGAYMFDGHYVLTNKVGGMSGRGITPIGIKCVKDITDALGKIPIIGCGGIYTANDVRAYEKAGATLFAIGSALAGMTEAELKKYFSTLNSDLERGTNNAEGLIKTVDMSYKKFKVAARMPQAEDFHILQMDGALQAEPGQFAFAWLPEKGEKPFSIMDTNPLTIAFSVRGCFTKELAKLEKGNEIYFRGPYGQTIQTPKEGLVLVGGGSGTAGIYLFAKRHKAQIFAGARDAQHLLPFEAINHENIYVATDDGSAGIKGTVSDLLRKNLKSGKFFVNCGPEPMIKAVLQIEKQFTSPEKIYSSIDYMTSCGVGICGKCADEKGLRRCVEGPFVRES